MASYVLRTELNTKPSPLMGKLTTKTGAWSPHAYCISFFAQLAVLLCSLRIVDQLTESVGGEPLLQPCWNTVTRRYPWLLRHVGFGAVSAFVAYVASCIYFTSLDLRRSMDTKVQKQYFPSVRDMLVAGAPQVVIYFLANYLWYIYAYQPIELPSQAPTLARLMEQLLVAFVVGDFLIYWEHRLMHRFAFTRKHIHSWHHAYTAPFSWAGGVVHPLEDIVVVLCQVAAPFTFGHHPLSFWIFVALWTVLLIEEHSGHDVPWAPYNWMPFARSPMGGGAAAHDIHHYKVTKNFAFVLCVWDHAFGTFEPVVDPPNIPNLQKAEDHKNFEAACEGLVSASAAKRTKSS
ncbi:hypothetical protein AB1Y20_021229 [Prymnesium parvum]|uniref:Fatty acid hydroxylase domain-containing protein n=1 Tax=Prymnesium parvum TaxID=97485 RepID=A0AB34JJ16_PRYPA